jgi:flagellar hook assembly protein FlgD
VYDTRGARVAHHVDSDPGEHSWSWTGTDERGAPVANGNYFVRLTSASGTSEMRVVMQR